MTLSLPHDEPWGQVADGLTGAASIGLATTHHAGDLAELFTVADRRLYHAKRAGRDRIVGQAARTTVEEQGV